MLPSVAGGKILKTLQCLHDEGFVGQFQLRCWLYYCVDRLTVALVVVKIFVKRPGARNVCTRLHWLPNMTFSLRMSSNATRNCYPKYATSSRFMSSLASSLCSASTRQTRCSTASTLADFPVSQAAYLVRQFFAS